VPAVVRHGDLWTGNLLAEGESLTGVIDWDAWHSDGVPGGDLMYLGVMDRARRTGRSSGQVWSDRPWRLPILRQAFIEYWSRLSLAPGEDRLEAAAVAGWAAQIASTLSRTPDLASTPRWFLRNVEPMLALAR
jgi:aminoglycoside phosphotransferase (APT) family kinase protein